MTSRVLVTGSKSGLGAFLAEKFAAFTLNRDNFVNFFEKNQSFDTIVHCAFSNATHPKTTENQMLLNRLLKIQHNKFIFISSCDVYKNDESIHSENETLDLNYPRTAYALDKMICEQMVESSARSPIIIRPTSLLGEKISRNLHSLIYDPEPQLTLTADSSWNFVTYQEFRTFLEKLLSLNYEGIINLARSKEVQVHEVASALGKNPTYGNFSYQVPKLNNLLALKILPDLSFSSLQTFKVWKGLS